MRKKSFIYLDIVIASHMIVIKFNLMDTYFEGFKTEVSKLSDTKSSFIDF